MDPQKCHTSTMDVRYEMPIKPCADEVMYMEVVDKFDNEEDDDIEETVQEIAKNPLEHNYPTPTVMATPTQQPVVQKE